VLFCWTFSSCVTALILFAARFLSPPHPFVFLLPRCSPSPSDHWSFIGLGPFYLLAKPFFGIYYGGQYYLVHCSCSCGRLPGTFFLVSSIQQNCLRVARTTACSQLSSQIGALLSTDPLASPLRVYVHLVHIRLSSHAPRVLTAHSCVIWTPGPSIEPISFSRRTSFPRTCPLRRSVSGPAHTENYFLPEPPPPVQVLERLHRGGQSCLFQRRNVVCSSSCMMVLLVSAQPL
jgi:hypothetical protein